jgi:hypothetical protein
MCREGVFYERSEQKAFRRNSMEVFNVPQGFRDAYGSRNTDYFRGFTRNTMGISDKGSQMLSDGYAGARQRNGRGPSPPFGQKVIDRDRYDSLHQRSPFGAAARSVFMDQRLGVRVNTRDIEEEVFTHEPLVNTPIPVNRKVSPVKAGVKGCARRQIALLMKNNAYNTNIIELEDETYAQGNAQDIVNPATWNMIVANQQKEMWLKEPERYRALSPLDVFQDWDVQGVMEADDMEAGDPTQRNRNCCIVEQGECNVGQYWPDIMPGSTVYMVIKKFNDAGSRVMMPPINWRPVTRDQHLTADEMVPMMPYQMGFYSPPFGSCVPDKIRQYYDENGFLHSDALVIKMGMIFSPAFTAQGNGRCQFDWAPNFDFGEPRCERFVEGDDVARSEQYTFTRLIVEIRPNC